MTEVEKALFICLESLADALAQKGSLNLGDYVMRLAAVGAQSAGQNGTTMTDALAFHMERLMQLSQAGYPAGSDTSDAPH